MRRLQSGLERFGASSAGEDQRVYLWDATPLDGSEGQELFTFSQHDDEIRSVVASPDGRKVASAGRGGIIKVWDAENGKQMQEIAPHFRVVFCLAWHPKEELIAAAGWDGRRHTVQVLDPRSRKTLSTIPPGRDNFTAAYYVIAFSPDGRFLITGEGSESGGGAVNVWDVQTGRQVGSIGTYAREVRGVVFSPNPVGRLPATASGNGEISILDGTRLDKEQVSRDLIQARVPGPCLNIAFGPDGKWLATGGDDDTIRIWDVMTRRESHPPLRGHKGDVYALAVSPDGRWIASGGEDSRVKVWDTQNDFRLAHNFKGHTGLISSVTLDPKSLRLYSGSRDHTVKAWDVSKPGDGPSSMPGAAGKSAATSYKSRTCMCT